MSIWSMLGAAGARLGRPLGALIAALGRSAAPAEPGGRDPTREVAFTIALIALSAKMARSDGHVSPPEVAAFREIFHVPPDELENVAFVFNLAQRSVAGFQSYARQVRRLFRNNPTVLAELIGALLHIAKADGRVLAAEDRYLREIAAIFGFDDAAYRRLKALHGCPERPDDEDPWSVLGLSPGADAATARATWRRLVRENHPDLLTAQGMPREFVALATDKLARINAAYDRIRGAAGAA